MLGIFSAYHQRKHCEAIERLNALRAIRGKTWKCGPWEWRT
jgi:hypothetical protein